MTVNEALNRSDDPDAPEDPRWIIDLDALRVLAAEVRRLRSENEALREENSHRSVDFGAVEDRQLLAQFAAAALSNPHLTEFAVNNNRDTHELALTKARAMLAEFKSRMEAQR